MHLKRLLFSLTLAILSAIAAFSPALAFPPLPSSFYGQVRVNNQFVPDGTLVRALIGGKAYAETRTQTYQGGSIYSLTVPGDDSSTPEVEGGREGDGIQFEVGGVIADQTGVWHSGTNQNLDLSVASGAPQPTSLPTTQPTSQPTSQPTGTPKPTRTAAATRVPPTAANPTLPAPTATEGELSVSPTALSTGPLLTPSPTAVSTDVGLDTQSAGALSTPQPTLLPGPTQASAAGETLSTPTAGASEDGAAPSGSITPGYLIAAIVGLVLLGVAGWRLLRRKNNNGNSG